MKKVLSLLLGLVLAFGMCATAYANGNVTYDGNAQQFIFAPGSDYSPTDLFTDFKGVMPGDSLTQQVLIKNEASNEVKIKLYMRSLGAQLDTNDFLTQMQLTVTQEGDSVLFDAPADQTAGLTDWVYLGTVYSGGEITLNVTLNVPATMGDEFQDQVGYIDWQFKIEELPVEKDDPSVDTGDTSDIMPYLLVGAGSLGLLVLLAVLKKKKDQ